MLGLKQHHLFAYIQQKGERYKRLRIEKTGLVCEEKLPIYLIGSICCKVEIAFSKAHMKFAILTKSFCILINPKYFESSVEKIRPIVFENSKYSTVSNQLYRKNYTLIFMCYIYIYGMCVTKTRQNNLSYVSIRM